MQTHTFLSRVLEDIPNHQAFVKAEPIRKGLSGDRKFALETVDGRRFLLRVSDIAAYERKKAMYEMMQRVDALGVPMSRPLGFGVCNGGGSVYQLLSWCDGETADVALPKLSETEQYALGVESGRILRKIHTIPAPDGLEDWQDRFLRDNDERVWAFLGCGVPIDGSDVLFAFYAENRQLLHGRPQCFLHSDFHSENLLIAPDHTIAVVDWELLDSLYGDPWLEFNRILCTELIPHFTSGQIYGYFGGEPPAEFWPLLAFYLSAGALMLVSWAVYTAPDCLEECRRNAAKVVHWFDGMRSPAPLWYSKDAGTAGTRPVEAADMSGGTAM